MESMIPFRKGTTVFFMVLVPRSGPPGCPPPDCRRVRCEEFVDEVEFDDLVRDPKFLTVLLSQGEFFMVVF